MKLTSRLWHLPVQNRTLLWICGISFSVVMTIIVLSSPLAKIYPAISVDLKVASYKNVEIFVDLGKGFSAQEKMMFLPEPGHFARFHATLPRNKVTGVRVDAGEKGNSLLIRSIEFISAKNHEKLDGEHLHGRVIKSNGIEKLHTKGNILHGVVTNDDPYIALIPEDLAAYPRVFWQQIVLALTVSLLAGGAFAFTVFSPGSSILFFFTMTFLLILQKSLSSHQFHFYTLFIDPLFLPSINIVVAGATLFTWGFNRYKVNEVYTQAALYQLYRSIFIALGVVFIGFHLTPGYSALALSCAVLIITFFGGELSIGLRQSMEAVVAQDQLVSSPKARLCKIALFTTIIFLIIGRAPALLTDPRMWAEDGGHTLVELATLHGWTAFFWYVEYFRILSNIAGLLSTRIFAIEYAAHVFTLIALVGKTVPFLIIIYGRSQLWNTLPKKTVVCLLILYAPMSAEIWLNVNGLHYYMALATVLLLPEIELAENKFRRRCYYILLGTAGLSGILTCVMTPLYALRALQTRNKRILIAVIILACTSMFQLYMKLSFEYVIPRGSAASTDMAGWIMVIKTILLPLSVEWAKLGYSLSRQATSGLGGLSIGQILLAGYIAGYLGLLWFLRKNVAAYLLLAGIGLVVIALFFAIGGSQQEVLRDPFLGNRYFYTANAIFLIVLVAFFQEIRDRVGKSVSAAILFFCVTFTLSNNMSLFYMERVVLDDLPSWGREISLWRENPQHNIRIWPHGWQINLE